MKLNILNKIKRWNQKFLAGKEEKACQLLQIDWQKNGDLNPLWNLMDNG